MSEMPTVENDAPFGLNGMGNPIRTKECAERGRAAEEFEALRRLGPKYSRAQWSRMQELERILDAREPGRGGKHLTDCPSCGVTFGVSAKHMVRQRARCRPCIRTANGWTCQTCGSADPHHPFPCPSSDQEDG